MLTIPGFTDCSPQKLHCCVMQQQKFSSGFDARACFNCFDILQFFLSLHLCLRWDAFGLSKASDQACLTALTLLFFHLRMCCPYLSAFLMTLSYSHDAWVMQDHWQEDQPSLSARLHRDVSAQLRCFRTRIGSVGNLHGPQLGHAAWHL